MINETGQYTDMINNPTKFSSVDILNNEIYSGLISPSEFYVWSTMITNYANQQYVAGSNTQISQGSTLSVDKTIPIPIAVLPLQDDTRSFNTMYLFQVKDLSSVGFQLLDRQFRPIYFNTLNPPEIGFIFFKKTMLDSLEKIGQGSIF